MPRRYLYDLGRALDAVAEAHADRPALRRPGGEVVSHGELRERALRLAGALHERGVRRGARVCLVQAKSTDALATMLACLELGAAYANLDPASPARRLERMLGRCRPALVVHEGEPTEALASLEDAPRLPLAELADQAASLPAVRPPGADEVTGAEPAYVMFTSGSTGFPKGAVMTHANVLNLGAWGEETFDVAPDDVFTNVNPIYFDNSVFDVYVPLLAGASLCPFDGDLVRSPRDLVRAVEALGCTVWFSVPSMLVYLLTTRALERGSMPTLRAIAFGGEGFPKPKLRELHELVGDRTRLVNVYGPTECTCICSAHVLRPEDLAEDRELAPLGRLAPNFGGVIVPTDPDDPDVGELLLTGPQVGLGYLNDEERTREAFVPDPTAEGFARVAYRTGDLVQRDAEGLLRFRGRVDNQVKHMGHRIELEEIEAALSTLPYVDEVGVVHVVDDHGLSLLVAYVASARELDEREVVADARGLLPPYMVPGRVRRLVALPKNANGKIDRRRLKEMEA